MKLIPTVGPPRSPYVSKAIRIGNRFSGQNRHTEDPRKQGRNSIASRRRNRTIMMALPPIVVVHRIVGHVAARKLTLFGGLRWAGVNELSSREVTGRMKLRSRQMTARHVCAGCRSRGM